MNPLASPQHVSPPLHPLTRAVLRTLKALLVLALCALINALTSPGHWWFQWVAFGLGIALLVTWVRALGSSLTSGLVTELERRFQGAPGTAEPPAFKP